MRSTVTDKERVLNGSDCSDRIDRVSGRAMEWSVVCHAYVAPGSLLLTLAGCCRCSSRPASISRSLSVNCYRRRRRRRVVSRDCFVVARRRSQSDAAVI